MWLVQLLPKAIILLQQIVDHLLVVLNIFIRGSFPFVLPFIILFFLDNLNIGAYNGIVRACLIHFAATVLLIAIRDVRDWIDDSLFLLFFDEMNRSNNYKQTISDSSKRLQREYKHWL